jgi:cell division protein FtsZ
MNPNPENTSSTEAAPEKITLKIFGVGNAGIALVERMAEDGFQGASFAAVNADARSMKACRVGEKILLEKKMLRGMGTGGDPERGRLAAEEHLQKLKEACTGLDVALIITGLGGGAGTGISPVLARVARESGALTLVMATLPFDCEGNRRQRQALEGLDQLKSAADGVICLPNQKVFKLIDENTSVMDTFRKTSDFVLEGMRGLWRLLTQHGLIDIHLDDLRDVLRERRGESRVAVAEASGPDRALEVGKVLFAHPLLEGDGAPKDADAIIVSIVGGPDLTMKDVHSVMQHIRQCCGRAQVVMGAAINEAFREKLSVTLIATEGKRATEIPAADEPESLDDQLLEKETSRRPASRFVPPAPTLSQEQQVQLLNKQSGRPRKASPRMKQTQLPLEIINKGRFDKSEPTIHKGEDLDVPTFIRRGVALN